MSGNSVTPSGRVLTADDESVAVGTTDWHGHVPHWRHSERSITRQPSLAVPLHRKYVADPGPAPEMSTALGEHGSDCSILPRSRMSIV